MTSFIALAKKFAKKMKWPRLRFFQKKAAPSGKIRLTQDDIQTIRTRRIHPRAPDDKPFRNADASELSLSEASWDGEDFTGCDLRGADLRSCAFGGSDFCDADLWNADLRESDLTKAQNLLPAQVAAADLTRAKLPPELGIFQVLDAVKDLSDNASKVFLIMLGAVAYTFLTIATTKDAQLLVDTNLTKLPIIGTDVPIISFYRITPLVLLAVFIYFHIYLQRLWESMSRLPAIFPDGRRLDERTPAWLLTHLARRYFPRVFAVKLDLSLLQTVLVIFLAYWLVPISLFAIWARLLFLRDWGLTIFHIVTLTVAVAFMAHTLGRISKTLGSRELSSSRMIHPSRIIGFLAGIPAGLVTLLLLASCSFALLEWDRNNYEPFGERQGLLFWRLGGARLERAFGSVGIRTWGSLDYEDISVKPTTWTGLAQNSETELAQTRGFRVENLSLHRAHAMHAFFYKSALTRVEMDAAVFDFTDFRGAIFQNIEAVFASLVACRFSDDLKSVGEITPISNDLRRKFHPSAFDNSNFIGAKFLRASLSFATADGVDFTNCDFRGATCFGIRFESCALGNAKFGSSDCRNASFRFCDLQEASFSDAKLDNADFEEATSLTEEQLRKSKNYLSRQITGTFSHETRGRS